MYSSTLSYEPWLTATLETGALLSVILGLQWPDFDALIYALFRHISMMPHFSLDISMFKMICSDFRRIFFPIGVIFGR